MTRRLAAIAAGAVLLAGCGMTVGLRPADEGTRLLTVQAAPVERGETVVAGVTLTTLAREASAERAQSTTEGDTTDTSDAATPSTTTTIAPTSSTQDTTGSTTSTTAVEPTTTTTTVATTTTVEVPPSSSVSLPDFPDIGTVFADDDAFVTHDCAGGDVTISGDAGTYTLEGLCRSVLIRGSFNTVFVDELGAVDLLGTLNAVVYAGGDPIVNDWGGDNIVTGS